jgi:hypothetical protein
LRLKSTRFPESRTTVSLVAGPRSVDDYVNKNRGLFLFISTPVYLRPILPASMSRIPQSSSSRVPRSPNKLAVPIPGTPRSKTPTAASASPASPRIRTKSTPSKAAIPRRASPDKEPPLPMPAVSLRDAIALKRAEAKKALVANKNVIGPSDSLQDANPVAWNKPAAEQTEDLGRWSLRETIERARISGELDYLTISRLQ